VRQTYRTTHERLWQALTDPKKVQRWMAPAAARIESVRPDPVRDAPTVTAGGSSCAANDHDAVSCLAQQIEGTFRGLESRLPLR
jgi:hypothetical protein